MKYVYLFEYNDCIHESDYGVVSVHASRETAQKALDSHKQACKEEHDAIQRRTGDNWEFGEDVDWRVREIEVIE